MWQFSGGLGQGLASTCLTLRLDCEPLKISTRRRVVCLRQYRNGIMLRLTDLVSPLSWPCCVYDLCSLALMGTDYGAFLVEASRVLKPGGWLWVAEVRHLTAFLLALKQVCLFRCVFWRACCYMQLTPSSLPSILCQVSEAPCLDSAVVCSKYSAPM
jgi:hypothetical protein